MHATTFNLSLLTKPAIAQVDYAAALAWMPDDAYLDQEKIDGHFAVRAIEDSILVGEIAKTTNTFYPFDIVQYQGVDIRHMPLRERLIYLDEIMVSFTWETLCLCASVANIIRPSTGTGGKFLEEIVARGGEGIIRKKLSGGFGQMQWKAKREQNFQVRITQIHCQSVSFVETEESLFARITGRQSLPQDTAVTIPEEFHVAGKIPLRMAKIEKVRVGSLIKVVGFGVSAQNAIREPRLDTDTPASWLIQY